MDWWRNNEAASCNHCSGKAKKSIKYSECVSAALGIQHAVRMHHIVFCRLSRGPSGRAVYVNVWMLACWDCGFESRLGHGVYLCCVLMGRGISDELITCLEESYRTWCFVVCDVEISWMRRSWPAFGHSAKRRRRKRTMYVLTLRYVRTTIVAVEKQWVLHKLSVYL